MVGRLSPVPINVSVFLSLKSTSCVFSVLYFDSLDGFIPEYFNFLSHQMLTLIIYKIVENFQILNHLILLAKLYICKCKLSIIHPGPKCLCSQDQSYLPTRTKNCI